MTLRSVLHVSLSCFALSIASIAAAQDIRVDVLGSASAYDVGTMDMRSGGLDPALWQGTSAATATQIIESTPLQSRQAIIRDLIRVSLLSAGVPPKSVSEAQTLAYNQARLMAISRFADTATLQAFLARGPEGLQDPVLKSDLALINGESERACSVAATISEGRALPYWAKLRAFCHLRAGENAAAELTTDLLRRSGHEDPTFFNLMTIALGVSKLSAETQNLVLDEGLDLALASAIDLPSAKGPLGPRLASLQALDEEKPEAARLSALFESGAFLTDAQIVSVLQSFEKAVAQMAGENPEVTQDLDQGALSVDATDRNYDIELAKTDTSPEGLWKLYSLLTNGETPEIRAQAIVAFLDRADARGQFTRFGRLIAQPVQDIPVNVQAVIGLKPFTRLAIARNDIVALQGLYNGLEEGVPQRARIALIADAIGNGFFGGGLGREIEDALKSETDDVRAKAVRESYIAISMGAVASAEASENLLPAGKGAGRAARPGAILLLNSAARRGARAETALRTALILAGPNNNGAIGGTSLDSASLSSVISALRTAGLENYAARLAAEDFLSGL